MRLCKDVATLALLLSAAAALCFISYAESRRAHMENEIAWTVTAVGIQADAAREQILALADQHATAIRRDLIAEVQATREAAVNAIEHSRETLSGDLGATVGILDRRLASLQMDLNTHGLIVERSIDRTADGIGEVTAEAKATLAESRRTVHDLHPQILGLVAASKVTAGETAQTMRVIRDATPAASVAAVHTVQHVDAITLGIANPFRQIGRWIKSAWRRIF